MNRVLDEPALVLHVRPYRETSAIVSLLTPRHGRVAVVARGARTRRGSSLQPFNRIRAAWQGRGALATLTRAEPDAHVWLSGTALAAGLYVIELIDRLVGEREGAPRLYAGACWTLERLAEGVPDAAIVLRQFEQLLLAELGYAIDFERLAAGEPIEPDRYYAFESGFGFVPLAQASLASYPGHVLLAIAAGDYDSRLVRVSARRITRRALAALLGPRPLISRALLSERRSLRQPEDDA
ncbi:MAG: DNA repair protein RecO [Gammaproteobacteria bacterium]